MRSLVILGAVTGLAAAYGEHQSRGELSAPPHLWEVLGEVAPVLNMSAKETPSLVKTGARKITRTPENCVFPLDVVILQDATDSFSDNIESMTKTQLDLIYQGITSKHPDSRFGVVSFKDKPLMPFGNRDDYCSRVDAPLSGDISKLKAAYKTIVAYGGADAPENQFGTLYNALDSAAVGWTPSSLSTKLVIVSTDAGMHFAGDDKTGTLPPFDIYKPQDENLDICLAQYYPSAEQVRSKIAATGTYVASLVYDGDWANGWPSKSWITFNEYIGQTADFVAAQAPDSSDFWARLATIVERIEALECAPETTPVPAVVTTAGTPATTTAVVLPPPVTAIPPVPTSTAVVLPPPVTAVSETTAIVPPAPIITTAVLPPVSTEAPIVTTAILPPVTTIPVVATTAILPPVTTIPGVVTTAYLPPPVTTIPGVVDCKCPCEKCTCCAEVSIKLLNRPKELHLDVVN